VGRYRKYLFSHQAFSALQSLPPRTSLSFRKLLFLQLLVELVILLEKFHISRILSRSETFALSLHFTQKTNSQIQNASPNEKPSRSSPLLPSCTSSSIRIRYHNPLLGLLQAVLRIARQSHSPQRLLARHHLRYLQQPSRRRQRNFRMQWRNSISVLKRISMDCE
jgi:hypothetical protein